MSVMSDKVSWIRYPRSFTSGAVSQDGNYGWSLAILARTPDPPRLEAYQAGYPNAVIATIINGVYSCHGTNGQLFL